MSGRPAFDRHAHDALDSGTLGGSTPLRRPLVPWPRRGTQRLVPRRIALHRDHLTPKVLLGGQCVVRSTTDGEIVGVMLPMARERVDVVNLEAVDFTAATSRLIDERALPSISFEHAPSNPRRNITGSFGDGWRCRWWLIAGRG